MGDFLRFFLHNSVMVNILYHLLYVVGFVLAIRRDNIQAFFDFSISLAARAQKPPKMWFWRQNFLFTLWNSSFSQKWVVSSHLRGKRINLPPTRGHLRDFKTNPKSLASSKTSIHVITDIFTRFWSKNFCAFSALTPSRINFFTSIFLLIDRESENTVYMSGLSIIFVNIDWVRAEKPHFLTSGWT